MATVHRATVELGGGLRRDVALKRLLPHLAEDDRFVEDFVREAKLAVHLRHPNIIQIYDLGRIGDTYFIAMELVRGISLMTLMKTASKRKRTLPLGGVVSLMLELTDALDHAHNGTSAHGEPMPMVHRDLTPSNLLVTDDGHLKIIDFGIAKAMRGDLATDSGRAKGKLGYMAIEALRADAVDARADLFSTGVVMWELLTNRRLFKSPEDWDLLAAIRNTIVPPPSKFNSDVPSELDTIVLRAVAKKREERWQTAEALHRALAAVARNLSVSPLEVVRAKQSLRPETSADPYAGFEIELEMEVDDDEVPSVTPVAPPPIAARGLDWTGALWPPEPVTEPKLRVGVEGTSNWPVEPPTEERRYTEDVLVAAGRGGYADTAGFPIESASVQIRELPVEFQPADYDRDRVSDTKPTERVPTIAPPPSDATTARSRPAPEPPTEPRKPRPEPATAPRKAKPPPTPSTRQKTKLGAIKLSARRAPPPFRNKSAAVRKPAPSPVVDHVEADTRDDSRAFGNEGDTEEAKQFHHDSDTVEGKPFDDE